MEKKNTWNSSHWCTCATIYLRAKRTKEKMNSRSVFGINEDFYFIESSVFPCTNNHHFMWPYYLALYALLRMLCSFFNHCMAQPKKALSFFTLNAQRKPRERYSITLLLVVLLGPRYFMFSIAKSLNQTPQNYTKAPTQVKLNEWASQREWNGPFLS